MARMGKTNGAARAPRKRKGEAGVAAEAEAATPVAGRGSKRATSQNPGNGAAPAKTVGANVTDGAIRDFYGQALAAKVDLEKIDAEIAALREDRASKNGAYRNVLKSAEKAGIPAAAIRWRLEQRTLDIDDINRHIAWCNRIAFLTRLPIGTQLGLFEDGQTVAAKLDAAAAKGEGDPAGMLTVSQLVAASDEGEKARADGKLRIDNPYEFGTPLSDRWFQGWDDENKRQLQVQGGQAMAERAAPEMGGQA